MRSNRKLPSWKAVSKYYPYIAVTVLFAVCGIVFIFKSHADTLSSAAELENGTIYGAAASVTDSGASGDKAVRFGQTIGSSSFIIGTNNGGGWGAGPAATLVNAGIKWDRMEFNMPSMNPPYQTVADDIGYGFSITGIINTDDSIDLKNINVNDYANYGVSIIKANPNIKLWEVINEPYYKGDRSKADAASYGKLYLALYNAVKGSDISGVTLMFNMFGDYSVSDGNWSQDANNGGWLRDAVNANPGLKQAIASQAYAVHPYGNGSPDENSADDHGIASLAAQEQVSQQVIGSIPPFYLTEHGYNKNDMTGSVCSNNEQEVAYKLMVSYNTFVSDPHVKGIWWYSSHDDDTGLFGLMNDDGSTRPAFNALKLYTDGKQHTPTCTP